MKLPRGASFIEFYYRGLSIFNSEDLRKYILANYWYFKKSSPEVQNQFRRAWKYMYEKEKEENEYYR